MRRDAGCAPRDARHGARDAPRTRECLRGRRARIRGSSPLPSSFALLAPLTLPAEPLPGTAPLEETGDLAAKMVDGIHAWLDREEVGAIQRRRAAWDDAAGSGEERWKRFVEERRSELRGLMAVDRNDFARAGGFSPLPLRPGEVSALAPGGAWSNLRDGVTAEKVQWRVAQGLVGQAWRLRPAQPKPGVHILFLTDSELPTAVAAGVLAGPDVRSAWPWRLARMGADVIILPTVSRAVPKPAGGAQQLIEGLTQPLKLPGRELLWRVYSELGRTVAAVEWAVAQSAAAAAGYDDGGAGLKGIVGVGEGGWTALVGGASGGPCHALLCSGAFAPAGAMWQQPIDRSFWRFHRTAGPAELAVLNSSHRLIVDASTGSFPRYEAPPPPAAPGTLAPPAPAAAQAETQLAAKWLGRPEGPVYYESERAFRSFATAMDLEADRDPGRRRRRSCRVGSTQCLRGPSPRRLLGTSGLQPASDAHIAERATAMVEGRGSQVARGIFRQRGTPPRRVLE